MSVSFVDFFDKNASAVFGVGGALGGALLSYVAAFMLRKRDYRLRVWEKLFDRRIAAHESVISVATELRVMVGVGGVDVHNEVRRAPEIMRSRETFEEWFAHFSRIGLGATTWLNISTRRELNLIQDYLVTLHLQLEGVLTDKFPKVGELIRPDFINLSSSLEKAAYSFFERDIHRLRLTSLKDHHKYPPGETERRLASTELLTKAHEIRLLIVDLED